MMDTKVGTDKKDDPADVAKNGFAAMMKAEESGELERARKIAADYPGDPESRRRMLAQIDPGYSHLAVTSLLDTHLNNGTLHVVGTPDDAPAEVVSGEVVNNLFFDVPPTSSVT